MRPGRDLDLIDRKILVALMEDATLPIAQIAERVGLSQTPCWKRIQKLEAAGIIKGRVVVVDPALIGFGLSVFVAIEAIDHSPDWREHFLRVVDGMDQIMDVWRMAGQMDYLLHVTVPDMTAFDAFYRQLTDQVPLKNVTSHFSIEKLKSSTVYPLDVTHW